MRRAARAALAVLVWLSAAPALAQEQLCEEIATSDIYQQLLADGANLARDDKPAEALVRFETALAICPYDPIVSYYIARAHQLMGECDTAIAMYKQAEAYRAKGSVQTPLTAERIEEHLDEATRTCRTVARYEVACADEGVSVRLGDGAALPCPISGETYAGKIVLVATREGFQPHTIDVALVAGRANTVTVPSLVPEGPRTGVLAFTCSGGVGSAQLTGPSTSEAIACNERFELEPGTYALESEFVAQRAWIEIKPGREVELRFTRPPTPATDGTFVRAGWALLGTGSALLIGGGTLLGVARYEVATLDRDLHQRDALARQEQAEALDAIGWASLGVGLGSMAVGTVLLLLDESTAGDERPPSDREGALEASVGVGGGGVRVRW